MAKSGNSIRLVPQTIALPTYEFDQEQSAAISHRNSPLIIRGKTGTGKSTVAIAAAIDRIKSGTAAEKILFVSFGRDNAAAVRDSIVAAVDGSIREPLARTFHSLAFSILSTKVDDDFFETVLISGAEQESAIRDLLQGDVDDGYQSWPEDLWASAQTLGEPMLTQGFIRELRDLMMRANERGITPDELAAMGDRLNEKYWPAAAQFWLRYQKMQASASVGAGDAKFRIDPSELINQAIGYLTSNETLLAKVRSQFSTIIVDEFQESDPAQRQLLKLIAGEDLIIVVDPAVAVGRFRGSDPDGVDAWLENEIPTATTIELLASHRNHPTRLTFKAVTASEEAQYIAYEIKRAHLIDKIAYSDIAVIVRSHGSASNAIRRACGQSSIPLEVDKEAIATNSAIAPFLLLARIATGTTLTYDVAQQLLTSEFGGATSLSLRRTRTALLQARDTKVDTRNGAQLIIDAIDKGDIAIEDSAELMRVHTLLGHARAALRGKNPTIHQLLWAIWENAENSDGEKIATAWQNAAIKGGARGAAADRDLDAMVQLFDSAARHMERVPGSHPRRFLEEIADETIVNDVIAFKGQRPDVVSILTVHSAKGRQFKRVFVAGLQEGIWPNLKQRSSLLGAERLVERVRHGEEIGNVALDAIAADSLLEDEKRLFHVAVTRASEEVHLTAFEHEEDIPSPFFLDAEEAQEWASVEFNNRRPITANSLVAELRRSLSGSNSEDAATLLASLSQSGIAIADPHQWTGALPISTTEPLVSGDELVRLSPSAADAFNQCELKWLLEKNGGHDGQSSRALLGSIIHEYARISVEDSAMTREAIFAQFKELWPAISDQQGWLDRKAFSNAEKLLSRFFEYQDTVTRDVVGVEIDFDFTLGNTRIKGSIDRLEVEQSGKYVVVDFKTGKAISAKEATENLQLASYQLAVMLNKLTTPLTDAPEIESSHLVYLGHDVKDVDKIRREREPIDRDAVTAELLEISERMSGTTFTAKKNDFCMHCPVKIACPIFFEGATVIG